MASVIRVNGLKATVGVPYYSNCNLYKVTIKNTSGSAIDLRAEDDAVNEAVEQIVKELNPLAYFTDDGSNGTMYIIVDKAINSAIELQKRIRTIGKDTGATTTSIGPNDIDISGTTVVPATSIAGVTTITGLAVTGTAGEFSCTDPNVLLETGMRLTISGTAGGTGSITGYSDPTTYLISQTNGSTTFTLTATNGNAIVTSAGTLTGLTYTLN